MKIELLRTAYPRKVDHELIAQVRNQLEKEGTTSEEKIKEIFQEINVDIDLEKIIDDSMNRVKMRKIMQN